MAAFVKREYGAINAWTRHRSVGIGQQGSLTESFLCSLEGLLNRKVGLMGVCW